MAKPRRSKQTHIRRRYRLTQASFTPAAISGLTYWFDAGAITGIADAGAITTWSDISGSGNNVTQATAGNKPTLRTNIVNSRPVVRFDGTDDWLAGTGSVVMTAWTVFIVFRPTSGTTNQYVMDLAGGDADRAIICGFVDNVVEYFEETPSRGQAGASDTTNFHLYNATRPTTGTMTTYRNGVAGGTDTVGSLTTTTLSLASAAHASWSGGFGGDIAEIVVYNSALATENRKRVEQYLGNKYAIAITV